MNLTDLTNYVWTQTDTTEFDLAQATISSYLDEAFQRTIAAENRWPSYEASWEIIIPAGSSKGPLDTNVNRSAIMSLSMKSNGWKIRQINQEEAEARYGYDIDVGNSDTPAYWSTWGREVYLWPSYEQDEDRTVILRGYRHPRVTFDPTTGEVDADLRLHQPLAHYAVALAYAAQEDEVLETTYMGRWQRDVEMARKAIMDPSKNRPIVMYGNWPRTPIGGYGMRYGPAAGVGGLTFNPPATP